MNEEQSSGARLSEIFNEAKVRPPGAERQQFLEEACDGDATLRAAVEDLLRAYEDASRFLKPGSGVSPELEAQIAALEPEEAGDRIGHYKLLQQIGEGGFGVVWMAEQMQPVQRRVALKIIKLGMDTKEVIARFEQERQALAMMDHPNIARVLDAGATPTGRPYFVMELVRGIKITEYCDQGNLPTAERLQLFIAVCHAVQHAHQKGIIHRDLKPSNILVTLHDGVPVPKVIDFGVAKATQSQRLTELTLFTQFQQMIGTPLYMSPEQAEMSGLDIDTRSDIYSLGVLLYELLVGRTPFDPERLLKAGHDEMRRLIREEDPPKPSTALSTMQAEMRTAVARHRHADAAKMAGLLRGDLDWIVMKALEKDRSRRYETANGFAADVQRYLADQPVAACPPSATYRLKKFARRNTRALAVAALVLFSLMLAGSGVGWALRDRTARHARLAGQVDSILTEVDQLLREQKWAEALIAARRAEAALTGGEADAATGQRVRERLKDLEFIDRLEEIRMQSATWIGEKFDHAGADREYARAFREYGVDVDKLPIETSIDRLKCRPALAIPMAVALDTWMVTRWINKRDPSDWKRLVSIARGIDPEPLRDRMRAARGQPVSKTRDELRQLAESIDVRAHRPDTLVRLADMLWEAQHRDLAQRLLRDAQSVYPGDFWINFMLAQFLDVQKDYEGAVRFFTAAVSIRPKAVAALNNLGNDLRNQKKLDEAMVAFRRCMEVDPKFPYGYSNLGAVLLDQGMLDEAVAAYRKGLEFLPKDARNHFQLGRILQKQGKVEEAIAAFRKAIELDPKSAHAFAEMGNALLNQKKHDEAIAAFLKAIAINPKDSLPYRNIGIALWQQHKLDEAVAAFRESIEADPKEAWGYENLGSVLCAQNKLGEAIEAYRAAIELNPNIDVAHGNLGTTLQKHGKPDEAIAAFRKAIELRRKVLGPEHPATLAAMNSLADSYTDAGRRDEALKLREEVLALRRKVLGPEDPATLGTMNNLADSYADASRRGEALKLREEVLALRRKVLGPEDPDTIGTMSNLANSYADAGRQNEALKLRDEALALRRKALGTQNPSTPGTMHNLAASNDHAGRQDEVRTLRDAALALRPPNDVAWELATNPDPALRDPARAVVLAEKAVAEAPKDANCWNTLGVARYRAGDWKGAIDALQKFRELRTGTGEWNNPFFLAMAHWQLGNKDEARQWHAKGVEWMDKQRSTSETLKRSRSEAAELLGVNAER